MLFELPSHSSRRRWAPADVVGQKGRWVIGTPSRSAVQIDFRHPTATIGGPCGGPMIGDEPY